MKRHVSKTLLVMALTLSSVSSFVGCKDYDEDVYVDLKSRITKETSLREALQIQVNELEAYVKTLKSCECDLSEYLTKLQADKTYMKKADFEDQINQISLNQTAITLINKAIDEINWKLDQIKPFDDSDILKKINNLNTLILSVKETADQALEAARLGKCECNLKPLEDRVKTLEGLVAGWGERIEAVTSTAEKALAKAEKDSILLVKQQKTIDSLINVINNMDNTIKETVLKRIEALEKNTYTKAEIDKIIRDLNIPDVQPLLDRIKNIEDNYLTKKQIEDMINAIPVTDLSPIERRLAALEGRPVVDAYTKSEIDQMLQNLDIPQTDLTEILNRLNALEGKHFWTEQEILDLIDDALPEPYDHQTILDRLAALEAKPHIDAYTKAQVDAMFEALEIPADLTDRVETLESKKFWTEDEIKALIPDRYTNTEIDDMLQNLADGLYDKDAIDQMIENLNDAIEGIQETANEALELAQSNKGRLDDLEPRVGDLEDAVEEILDEIEDIKGRLETLEDTVEDLQDQIDALDERVTDLEEAVEKLQNDLQKMITGIIVQGTQNPVVGYLNTPFDARTTLLAVYYGTPKDAWQFPSSNSAHYARSVEFDMLNRNLSRTLQILERSAFNQISGSAGEMIVTKDGDEGNAGTLYLTINPSNVDFEGAELKLADSQDNELDILSPLERSDRTLTMGYTRSADNGFYEAAATITKNDVENMKYEVNMENLQESVKGMFKNNSDVYSIVDFGANIIKSLQTELPAWGVKASWTDESNGDEHKLYSQYNIGAMAVKPLSLSFLQDVKLMSKVPLIEDLEDMVGEIMREINISITSDLPDFTKIAEAASKIEFTDFSLPTIKEDAFIVTVKKTIDLDEVETKIIEKYFGRDIRLDIGRNGVVYVAFDKNENEYVLEVEQTYTDGSKRYSIFRYDKATGKFYQDDNEIAQFKQVPLEFEVEVTVDKTEDAYEVLQQILDQVNAKVGASGSLSSQVTDLLNEVAEIGNLNDKISVSLGSSKENIKSVLDRYITKLNNKLTDYVNRSTSIMHLALIANDGNNVGILSQTKNNPTNATGSSSLELYPTTYNLELLAPVYKKFVAVSDVFNADGTEADVQIAQTANNGENMAKVIDGDTRCTLKGQSGYIYEVMYTAVDYFGKVGLKKYYVKF